MKVLWNRYVVNIEGLIHIILYASGELRRHWSSGNEDTIVSEAVRSNGWRLTPSISKAYLRRRGLGARG